MPNEIVTFSRPPEVVVEGTGRDGAVPVITLDLEPPAIAASMRRRLFFSPHSRRLIPEDIAKRVWQLDLDLDAATELHEALGRALEVAETECAVGGCSAVGTLDGRCPNHADLIDRRGAGQ